MAIYMKFEGASGSATLQGYTDYSEISDLSWSASLRVNYRKNDKSPQMQHLPQLCQMSFKKLYDKMSGNLVSNILKGEVASTVTIKKLDGEVVTEQYILTNVIVSEYDFDGSGSRDSDFEVVTLDFTQWDYSTAEISDQLQSENTAHLTFNAETGQANA